MYEYQPVFRTRSVIVTMPRAFNEYTFKYSCLIRNKSNFFPNNSACTLTTNLKSNIYALDTLIIICAYLMQHLEKYTHKNSNKNLTKKEEEK